MRYAVQRGENVNDLNSEASPAYFYGNIMTGLSVSLDQLTIIGFAGIRNLFDKRYAGFINVNDFFGR